NTADPKVVMNGKEVFKIAVRKMGDISLELLENLGIEASQIDKVICHQANKRILQAVANHMKLEQEKVLCNLDKYGNTSAASIPLLLAEAMEEKSVKKGDLLLLNAFGGGATWGAIVVRM
ncbi:MAG: 3-oxoacyl-ACP synthase, partial [Proteobacteria bacterium]|nr:3-oxoacyl-ACP synthase [Pseudomonadota bacterium]